MPHHHKKNLGKYSCSPQPTMLKRMPKGDYTNENPNAVCRNNEFRKHQESVKDKFVEVDIHAKCEVNGYYRIPDWEKYINHAWEVQRGTKCGNCFITNFAKYESLRKSSGDKNLMLYVFRLEQGITHAIVLDGEVMYDYSQFREIKMSLHDYHSVNKVVAFSVFAEEDYQKALKTGDALSYFYTGICQEACDCIYQYRGMLRPPATALERAMRSIINL